MDGTQGVHTYRLLTALLLMPASIREFHKTPKTAPVLLDGKYSILWIDVDVLSVKSTSVLLRPKLLMAANTGHRVPIDYSLRLAKVSLLWDSAKDYPKDTKELILKHKEAVYEGSSNPKMLELYCTLIRKRFGAKAIEDLLGKQDELLEQAEGILAPEPELPEENDEIPPIISTRRQVAIWRKVKSRGNEGRQFSLRVKKAYDFRCLFSNQRLPSLEPSTPPGVDAAHILPWSEHKLNDLDNGICLSKNCHWAFDMGILRLEFSGNKYSISIPEDIKKVARKVGLDLVYFNSLQGAIPEGNLPKNKKYWPSREYISKLNSQYSD